MNFPIAFAVLAVALSTFACNGEPIRPQTLDGKSAPCPSGIAGNCHVFEGDSKSTAASIYVIRSNNNDSPWVLIDKGGPRSGFPVDLEAPGEIVTALSHHFGLAIVSRPTIAATSPECINSAAFLPEIERAPKNLEQLHSLVAAYRSVAKRCAEYLPFAQYGTNAFSMQLDKFREEMDIADWHLLGVSYGTISVLSYASAFPEHTERVLISSPILSPWIRRTSIIERDLVLEYVRRVMSSDLCLGRDCEILEHSPELDEFEARLRAEERANFVEARSRAVLLTASDIDKWIEIFALAVDEIAIDGEAALLEQLGKRQRRSVSVTDELLAVGIKCLDQRPQVEDVQFPFYEGMLSRLLVAEMWWCSDWAHSEWAREFDEDDSVRIAAVVSGSDPFSSVEWLPDQVSSVWSRKGVEGHGNLLEDVCGARRAVGFFLTGDLVSDECGVRSATQR